MTLYLPFQLPTAGKAENSAVQTNFDTLTGVINNGTGLVTSITGTANQVIASASTGAITLSLPQSIATSSTPTFASETLTATSNQLVLGTTRTVTLTAPTPASSSRTWTIPDLSTSPTFAALEGTQTFTGSKTFSSQIISTATSSHLKLATASNNAILSVASIATSDRTITIPDPGTNANFVLSEATATINGSKTFTSTLIDSPGTSDDTTYVGFQFNAGGNSARSVIQTRTHTGVTSAASTIAGFSDQACLILVSGSDGTNKFSDLLFTSGNASSPTTITSKTDAGSPAARTYTMVGTAMQLAVASGTYAVNTLQIANSAR